MDEWSRVVAHVHAVQPSAVGGRDSGQAQTAHGVRSVVLVEYDTGIEAAHGQVVPPHVVRLAADELDQV